MNHDPILRPLNFFINLALLPLQCSVVELFLVAVEPLWREPEAKLINREVVLASIVL